MSFNSDVFEPMSKTDAKQRAILVEWLNGLLPNFSLPLNASDEELRAFLVDGTVLCQLLNKLKPGSVTESSESRSEDVKKFLAAMDQMRLPRFKLSDLEKGSMKRVLECLLNLRAHYMSYSGAHHHSDMHSTDNFGGDGSIKWKLLGDCFRSGHSIHRDSSSRRGLRSPVMMAEPSAALGDHVGHKFHEVFQLKQGCYTDLPASKISEMMKSNSLDNAPTQSLLSVVNGVLDESIERKNGEIPHRVACLLRKVVQEIERRISTQAEHLKTQNNLFKAREEKYQSRIKVLEALAAGNSEETQNEQSTVEEKKKVEEHDVARLIKDKDDYNHEIANLKQELEIARKTNEESCLQMEREARGAQQELEERLREVANLLTESRNRVKELESLSESKSKGWNKKEHIYQIFTEFQLGALRELRFASQSIKQEILKTQKSYSEEFNSLGMKIKALQLAAENYYAILAENQKLHNELQELKGNIRVYCRIRPFLAGQKEKQTIVEYVGENGELIIVNPSKQGKEGRRSFKFNKVYGQAATQAEVYLDTQPLIQSVLDGYNVCIFAYGQTGSGKTYTMTGPDRVSEEEWGVNYRALNDLFRISQNRESTFSYEISVQMVEIYNEQVRDLLSSDGLLNCVITIIFCFFLDLHTLGILSGSQPNGLAVPDASMYPVKATSDVLHLMNVGLKNRAKSSTALNERSSRSHSIVSIHVRGIDQKTGSSMQSSLHLVDLAGSERVDRSEVTGDRLKEAQHINKSLSALGDVISALAQKSPHVPYRNSKLTQVLQSSLGGNAKTLMFVQLNPEVNSHSESMSTLKFAERVSGVELGAAKSSKDGRDVRELMEQVASLKDTIAKKDEEIERLQLKDTKNMHAGANNETRGTNSLRYGSSSPRKSSIGGSPQQSLKLSGGEGSGLIEKEASDRDNLECSDKHSIDFSQQPSDDFRCQKESLQQSKNTGGNVSQNISANAEILESSNADNVKRVIDISDSGVSLGTETDGSGESGHFSEGAKQSDNIDKVRTGSPSTPGKTPKDSSKGPTGLRKSSSGTNLSPKPPRRWQ
ncbi:hypothetical protein ACH5RR_024967 [Cinchona calisaya]|uniref:Kinesin-like protein n=1 Tax=Cinchona calisaya TaxID=153742 RepID=A0ABD2Z1N1_9GENT